ncbi:MAG: phosphoribosyl 1,2-cyclic phosphate phosphodiesterase [Spirosomataceae bacterium]|jgi:phosphoribosyl 1,2-cyclic phosphate phosphodiesterase
MQVTLLGTGTSGGVPVLTCRCAVCTSLDYRDKRLRTSVHLNVDGKSIVIDTGPDFRQQALRARIDSLDAVVFTHEHKDHTAGLDDIRPYNYLQGVKELAIYAHPRVLDQLSREFQYAFTENRYPGIPILVTNEIGKEQPFDIAGVTFTPIEVIHYKLPVLGFRVRDFTYLTDCNYIAPEELEKAKGTRILILDALQQSPHLSHFTLEQAIEVAKEVGAEKTYFTHISHKMGLHREVEKILPPSMFLAYDGLSFDL